jgi:hypothetical protein
MIDGAELPAVGEIDGKDFTRPEAGGDESTG